MIGLFPDAACNDPTVYVKYQAGFRECADEVASYLGTIDGLSGEVHARLLNHLHDCINRIGSISAAASVPQPISGMYPLHTSNAGSSSRHHLLSTAGVAQALHVQIPSMIPAHIHQTEPHHYATPIIVQQLIAGIPPTPPPSSMDSQCHSQSSPSNALLQGISHSSHLSPHMDPYSILHTNGQSRCSSTNSQSPTSSCSEDEHRMTSALRNTQSTHHNKQHQSNEKNYNNRNIAGRSVDPLRTRDMNLLCDINMNLLKDESPRRGGVKRVADNEEHDVIVKAERFDENQDDGDCWRPW